MRHSFAFLLFLAAASVPAFASVDDSLLALAPPGSKMIASVDVTRAKNSQFGQFLMSKMSVQNQGFDQLAQHTGFDPRRDLQDFVFASPAPNANNTQSSFLILARGIFDQAKIQAAATSQGAIVQSYRNVNIFLNKQDRHNTGFAFLDVGVAVMGDVSSVQQAIAALQTPTVLDPALQQMIASVGTNDAWFASIVPGSSFANQMQQQFGHQMNQAQQAQAFQAVLESSGGVMFGDAVQLSFDAVTRSPQDATALSDVVRFIGSMIQMQRQNVPAANAIASAIDNMTLSTNGNDMHMALSIPEKNLEHMAELNTGRKHPTRH